MRRLFSTLVLVLGLALTAALADAGESRALIIAGDPSPDAGCAENFARWAGEWQRLLTTAYGFKAANVRSLRSPAHPAQAGARAAKPEAATVPAAELANHEHVIAALAQLVKDCGPDDEAVVVLIGHGYQSEGTGKLCLPGADVQEPEVTAVLKGLKARRLVFFALLPDALGWAKNLAGPGRAIVLANVKQSAPYFGEFLLRALRPGKVTLLDAFNQASLKTINWYENQFVEKGKEAEVVHGKEFQEIFKLVYPDRAMEPGQEAAQVANNDPQASSHAAWDGRRVLVEIAGLEDDGDGKPATVFEAFGEMKGPSPLPSDRSKDGEFAKTIVLGAP